MHLPDSDIQLLDHAGRGIELREGRLRFMLQRPQQDFRLPKQVLKRSFRLVVAARGSGGAGEPGFHGGNEAPLLACSYWPAAKLHALINCCSASQSERGQSTQGGGGGGPQGGLDLKGVFFV